MKDINLPPFYVGQRVVALDDGPLSGLKKGCEYIILGNRQFPCGCWVVDVGLNANNQRIRCSKHNLDFENPTEDYWLYAYRFAPIQENFETISYEKVRELESPLINAN